MNRATRRVAACAALTALVLAPRAAAAFCRTTTAKVPANYDPTKNGCIAAGLPLYWANACISYDINQGGSRYITYDQASAAFATAFGKWTGTTCPGTSGPSRVSIDARDLGPVDCTVLTYNQNAPNQHAIIFHDDVWPYNDNSNTLALTTVTFDTVTGELYDADMEINMTTKPAPQLTSPLPENGYDFMSIITHETGHFLGLAHSADPNATMFATYMRGTTNMRDLTEDDVNGICTIYAPDGNRLAADGKLIAAAACDPTPHHGFSTVCDDTSQQATPTGCSVARGAGAAGGLGDLAWVALGAALGLRRRRRA